MRKKCSSDQEKLLKFEAEGPRICKHFEISRTIWDYWDLEICRKSQKIYIMSKKEAKAQQVYRIKKIFTNYNNLKILDTEKSLK